MTDIYFLRAGDSDCSNFRWKEGVCVCFLFLSSPLPFGLGSSEMPSVDKTSNPMIPWESMRWKLPVVKVLLPEWLTVCHIPNLKEENKYTVILLIFIYRKSKGNCSLKISVLTAWVTACKHSWYCYGDIDFLYWIVNLYKYLHQQIIERYCILVQH